ncbi:GNAT family N-acetyltransferase [Mycolicibacterium elephantis]|uniref:GNAT family N-acetyltransferase n=1 Tax=Mycolicibacterium elephantis TaxID=81858 RepID=UPI003A869B99
MKASVVRPHELGPHELACWREYQSADLSVQTPFLTPGFALAADAVSDRARVVVVEDDSAVVGFLPIELRSRKVATAIGGKVNTRQGFIHRVGFEWSWPELLKAAGLEVLELAELIGTQWHGIQSLKSASAPAIDTHGGWTSYLNRIAKRKAIKTVLYKERKLLREHPDMVFSSGTAIDQVDLGRLIAWKSRQYRRSGWPDLFARRDVVALLHRLAEVPGEGLYCVGSTLRVGEQAIATDLSLATDTVFTGWFCAHDTEWARYSPGAVRTLRTVAAAFARGVQCVDLSRGDEQYKHTLKTDDRSVVTGFVSRRSPRALVYAACRRPSSGATSYVLSHPEVRSLVRNSLRKVGRTREALAGRWSS